MNGASHFSSQRRVKFDLETLEKIKIKVLFDEKLIKKIDVSEINIIFLDNKEIRIEITKKKEFEKALLEEKEKIRIDFLNFMLEKQKIINEINNEYTIKCNPEVLKIINREGLPGVFPTPFEVLCVFFKYKDLSHKRMKIFSEIEEKKINSNILIKELTFENVIKDLKEKFEKDLIVNSLLRKFYFKLNEANEIIEELKKTKK